MKIINRNFCATSHAYSSHFGNSDKKSVRFELKAYDTSNKRGKMKAE